MTDDHPTGDAGPSDDRTPSGLLELLGIASLGIALVLDAITRFMTSSESMFHLANLFALVAAVLVVIDAVVTFRAYREHPSAYRLHLAASVAAAGLIVLSVALRVAYWTDNSATPIRAIVPAAIAFVLMGVVTWTNVVDRSERAKAPTVAAETA